jgi:hypothetical protein
MFGLFNEIVPDGKTLDWLPGFAGSGFRGLDIFEGPLMAYEQGYRLQQQLPLLPA